MTVVAVKVIKERQLTHLDRKFNIIVASRVNFAINHSKCDSHFTWICLRERFDVASRCPTVIAARLFQNGLEIIRQR